MSALREVSNLANQSTVDIKQRQADRIASTRILSQDSYRVLRGGGSGVLPPQSQSQPHASQTSFSGIDADSKSFSSHSLPLAPPPPPPRFNADQRHAHDPTYCTELIQDITDMFLERERQAVRRFNEDTVSGQSDVSLIHAYYASPHFLQYQPEVNEKMRMILIDWLIDVHLKFKLRTETLFLTVNIIDRYLSCVNTKHDPFSFIPRSQLQLVGVSAVLLAAKYEEIWPPEVKECVYISANTYTREEIIKMERSICSTLAFRFTVPTAYPFASRLLTVLGGENLFGLSMDDESRQQLHTLLRHTTGYFLEHALLDYKCLQFTPSQIGYASVFLALVTLQQKYCGPTRGDKGGQRIWSETLRHYSKAEVKDFRGCAEVILDFVSYVPTTKYQAVRRKYNSIRYGEITKKMMPNELPLE